MEPTPNSLRQLQDARLLLNTFPEEIWLIICDLVDDPSELVTLSHASTYWKDLLAPRRQQYMFPNVINILLKQKLLSQKDCHDLLQCRLVCHSWKYGVERLLETRSHYKNITFDCCRPTYWNDLSFPIRLRLGGFRMDFKLESQIIETLASRNCPAWNPFPSRTFYIYEIPPVEYHKYAIMSRLRNYAGRILELAGHHIWYAHISIGTGMRTAEWYTLLCRYVRLVPNLKCLNVKCSCITCHDWTGDPNVPPFPTLSDLELLSIEGTPYPVMNAMFQANPHVKSLIIPDALPCHADRGIPPNRQAHILDFNLIQNPQRAAITFPSLDDLFRLPTQWNLKVLRIGFAYSSGGYWDSIFEALGNVNTSFTELYIELPRARNPDDKLQILKSSRTKLRLPNVKKLEAKIENYCSLDFLLGLESLEHLNLTMIHDEKEITDGGEDVINYNNGIFERIPECNIWELMPTLNKIILNRFRKGKETFVRPRA